MYFLENMVRDEIKVIISRLNNSFHDNEVIIVY